MLQVATASGPASQGPDDGPAVAAALRAASAGQFIYARPGRLVARGQDGLDCGDPGKGPIWIVPGTTYDGAYVVDHLGCDELVTSRNGGLVLARGPRNTASQPANLTVTESFDATTSNGVAFSPGGPGGVVSSLQVNSLVPTPAPGSGEWTRPFVWGLGSYVFDGGRAAPDGGGGAQHVALTGQLERSRRDNGDTRQSNIGFGLYGHVGSPNDVPTAVDGSLVGAEIDVAVHNLDPAGARATLTLNCAIDGPGSGPQCGHGILFGDEDHGAGGARAFNTTLIDAVGAKYLRAALDLSGAQPVDSFAETVAPQPDAATLQLQPPLSLIAPGETVSGPGIAAGSVVLAADPVSGLIRLDHPATTLLRARLRFSSTGPLIALGDGRGIQMDNGGVFRVVYDPNHGRTEITVNGLAAFAVDMKGHVHVRAPVIADLP